MNWICAVCVVCLPVSLQASVLRGKVIHNGQPAPGIAVAVRGGSMGQSNPVRSAADGLYTIGNVPAGDYILQVWPLAGARPLTFQIHVREPQTDIFPVSVP